MSFRDIRSAQKAVWPAVVESLRLRRAQREAVNSDPRHATAAAQARARLPWNRVVADETVWAIAKADLLATPEQAAVVDAAREWARTWDLDVADMDTQERALYDAVQNLATAPVEETSEEVLTPLASTAYGFPNTN